MIKAKLNIGSSSISGIGDGTITGAISSLNSASLKIIKVESGMATDDHATAIKNSWGKFPKGTPFISRFHDDNMFAVVGYLYDDVAYGAVLWIGLQSVGWVRQIDGSFSSSTLS